VTLLSNVTSTVYTHPGNNEEFAVAWSPDGIRIATGSGTGLVQIWNVDIRKMIFYIPSRALGSQVYSLAWSPKGDYIATADGDDKVRVWYANGGETQGKIFNTYSIGSSADIVTSVSWSPDGTRLALGSNALKVRVWDVLKKTIVDTYPVGEEHSNENVPQQFKAVWDVQWSPDGKEIASGSTDKTVKVWSTITKKIIFTYHGHSDVVTAVAWSPDGMRIASASYDATVQIWDAFTGDNVITYYGHRGYFLTHKPSHT
jgi:WD40 repeat protein